MLAAVVCVLTLTIAGPVRTYFAQRTEMNQLAASEAALRRQIADLEQKKGKLGDPAYIAAQARERLGFVMPGDIPFQVQLPPTAAVSPEPGAQTAKPANNDPWYTALWHTIADTPHLPPARASVRRSAPAGGSGTTRSRAAGRTESHGSRWLIVPTWKRWRVSSGGSRAACSRLPTAAPTVNPAW